MCDLSLALTLGSTLLGAAGAVQQGQAAAQAAEYTAKVDEMNAVLADRRARDAIERGQADEQRKRQEVAQIRGRQVAAFSANNVDVTFGSPLDTIVDTAVLGELDALTIRTNSHREAYDFRTQAVNKRASAELNRMKGSAAETGGWLSAAGTVLTGVGKGYQQYRTARIGTIG